jgi:hypothetical protein
VREVVVADGEVTLPDAVPELTLGWGVVAWAGKYLKHGNGPRAGLPFRFSLSQVRFLLHFYAINPDGSWVYDRGVRRWPKGSGKSPFAAVHALAEFLGPVRLARFDPDAPGGCVGKRQVAAHVQIAATTLDQTANTMKQVRMMTPKGSRIVVEYGLDVGMLRHNAPDGGILEVITSSAAAAEGAEVTFAVADETEHWTPARGGIALIEVLERNLAKTGSRLVETCNAWQPGEQSVAEASWDMYLAQREGRTRGAARVLYDARIPAGIDLTDEVDLMAGLEFAYGDAADVAGGWVPMQSQLNYVLNGKTTADNARRFFLNQPTASVDAWTTQHEWSGLAEPRELEDGEDVALFFDGSLGGDATALMGCAISDGYVFTLGVWEPDQNDPDDKVNVAEVDLTVDRAFERFTVLGFFADVREWESFTKVTWPERYADQLMIHAVPTAKEPQPIAWDMRGQTDAFTKATELCLDEIQTGQFRHDGDGRVARHVVNARRRPNRNGIGIGKEAKDSPKKIDAAVCVIGARMVRRQVLGSKAYSKHLRRSAGLIVYR